MNDAKQQVTIKKYYVLFLIQKIKQDRKTVHAISFMCLICLAYYSLRKQTTIALIEIHFKKHLD